MKKLLINSSIEEFRNDVINNRPDQLKRLFEQCDRYKSVTLAKEHPKESTTYIGFACANQALAFLISGDESYLEYAKQWMFTAVSYEKWGNAHLVNVDLSASFILYGLSLSYNWLYEYLTPEERKLIEDKIILQANIMYDFKIETEGKGWSTNYWQNHNWINMSGLSMAGYALQDVTEDSMLWIDSARNNFKRVFDYFAEDGSNYEGTVYWRYGVIWMLIYADLEKMHGETNYFETSEYLKNTFYYRLYQSIPGFKDIVNFGDCHDRKSSHSLAMYYKFASEYNNEHAQFLGDKVANEFMYQEQYESGIKPGLLPEAFLELLWYDPKVESKSPKDLPLTYYFKDLGLISQRSSWEDDASLISFKCAAPGGHKQWKKTIELLDDEGTECFGLSHHHPDNNSFIMYNNGAYLFVDEGYNRDIKPHEHNVVTVDNKTLKAMDCNNPYRDSFFAERGANSDFDPLSFTGEITNYHLDDNLSLFTGETSAVYDRDLKLNKFQRSIINTYENFYIIIDELDSDLEHVYTQHFHTDNPPLYKDGVYNYQSRLSKYSLQSIGSKNLESSVSETNVRAVMTTQEPDKFRETKMQTINISSEKCNKVVFCTLINLDVSKDYTIEYAGYGSDSVFNIMSNDNTTIIVVVENKIKISNGKFEYESKEK